MHLVCLILNCCKYFRCLAVQCSIWAILHGASVCVCVDMFHIARPLSVRTNRYIRSVSTNGRRLKCLNTRILVWSVTNWGHCLGPQRLLLGQSAVLHQLVNCKQLGYNNDTISMNISVCDLMSQAQMVCVIKPLSGSAESAPGERRRISSDLCLGPIYCTTTAQCDEDFASY